MTIKASDIKVVIEADDTEFKDEIAKLIESDVVAMVEYSALKGQAPKPGLLPPLQHTYIKDGHIVVEMDAIYVVGEGYVYI
jgi:hypothetical protein